MNIARNPIRFNQNENPFISYCGDGTGKSRVYDIMWDFSALGQNTHKISFKSIRDIHRRDIQVLVAKMIEFNKDKSPSGHFSVATALLYRKSLGRLVNVWGKSDFGLLDNNQEWQAFRDLLKDRHSKTTLNTFRSMLCFLNKLGVISRYVTVKDFESLARKDSFPKQAIALPQQMHNQMLSVAVEFVETHYTYRHEISTCMANFFCYARE